MSLINPNNPARWADGTPRSMHLGFTTGFGEPIDWKRITANAAASHKSTANVERRRKNGHDTSTLHGLSRKSDENFKPYAVRKPRVVTKASILMNALKDGPKLSPDLAELAGVELRIVRKLLQYHIEHGRVSAVRLSGRVVKYEIAEVA